MSAPKTAMAFWVTHPGQGQLQQEPLPTLGEAEVHVRAIYSGVSRGTESLVFHARVPRA